jgi:predicted ATPase
LPDTLGRQQQELALCSALSAVLIAVKGFAAPETRRTNDRAQELWEQLGSPSEFLHVPYVQSSYLAFRGEFDQAQLVVVKLLRLGHQRNDAAGLVMAHLSAGRNLIFTGRFAQCRRHFEEALALYDPIAQPLLARQTGTHPRGGAQAYLAIVLLFLGYPDRALAGCSRAIAEVRRLAHPPSLASCLTIGATLISIVGDDAILGECTDELVAVATEHGFPFWRAFGTIYSGWLLVKNGKLEDGILLMRRGTAAYRATGTDLYVPAIIGLLASACEIGGRIEEAAALLNEALQIVERTGERWFAAELYRQKGQLLLRQGQGEAAEELYRTGLSIAKAQEAKLWELRAAVSLARLRRDQGRRAEAHHLLSPIYGWFTEGFDTPDLKEAKSLLDELEAA